MYLILDLHAAPGGQGKDANISDYDPAKPSLWESDMNRQKPSPCGESWRNDMRMNRGSADMIY